MKILVTIPNFSHSARSIIEAAGSVTYDSPAPVDLKQAIGNYEAILAGLEFNFNAEIFESAKQLKVLATATTGLDHIDLATAAKRKVEILSLRGEEEFLNSITGTAELAFGLILNLLRWVSPASEAVKRGEWDRERWRGRTLAGKTLGVVGVGRLGRMMARYASGFGLRVLGYDPGVAVEHYGAEPVDFTTLVKGSDIISLHLHLSDATKHLFDRSVLAMVKRGSYLVNTSRGEIVDEAAVLDALERDWLGGYATDVLSGETAFSGGRVSHPLIDFAQSHPNCLIVPHLGGMTYESREATDQFMAQKLATYLKSVI